MEENQDLKLKCKWTPSTEIYFTKDKVYDCIKLSEECYDITDDRGETQMFFRIDLIFEELQITKQE